MRWTYFCQQKFANERMIDGIIIILKSRNNYSEQSLKNKTIFQTNLFDILEQFLAHYPWIEKINDNDNVNNHNNVTVESQ